VLRAPSEPARRAEAVAVALAFAVLVWGYTVTYAPIDIPADTAAFIKEMADVASEWDKITGGVRDQNGQPPGPYFIQWTSPDSVWTGTINYFGSPRGNGGRPNSFEIKERKWQDRQLARLDSLQSAGKLR